MAKKNESKGASSKLVNIFKKIDTREIKSAKAPDPARYKEQIKMVVQEQADKALVVTLNDIQKYHECLTLYLYGHTYKDIEQAAEINRKQLETWSQKNNWENLRIRFFRQVEKKVLEESVSKESLRIGKTIDVVNELVQDLVDKAIEHSRSLEGITGKDYVRFALDGLKLKAQLSGEFVENKNVTVGSAQAFQKIMEMPKINPEDIMEGDMKLVESPKLLE